MNTMNKERTVYLQPLFSFRINFRTLFLVIFNDCQRLFFLGFICDKNSNHLLTHNLDVSFQNYAFGDL